MKRFLILVALITLLCHGLANHAMAAPIYTLDNTTANTLFINASTTAGWQFQVNSTITVTHLGVFDSGQDGLAFHHNTGIWNSGGSLIASATVASGTSDPLTNQFRYHPVNGGPVTLAPGTYTIGATFGTDNILNDFLLVPGQAINFSTDPSITFLQSRVIGGDLINPTNPGASGDGYFGPNFLIQSSQAAVPEPGTIVLFGMVLLCLAGYCLRRRNLATT